MTILIIRVILEVVMIHHISFMKKSKTPSVPLPDKVFQQEYLAQFIDGGGEVFQNLDKNKFRAWTPPQGKVYCGI